MVPVCLLLLPFNSMVTSCRGGIYFLRISITGTCWGGVYCPKLKGQYHSHTRRENPQMQKLSEGNFIQKLTHGYHQKAQRCFHLDWAGPWYSLRHCPHKAVGMSYKPQCDRRGFDISHESDPEPQSMWRLVRPRRAIRYGNGKPIHRDYPPWIESLGGIVCSPWPCRVGEGKKQGCRSLWRVLCLDQSVSLPGIDVREGAMGGDCSGCCLGRFQRLRPYWGL